MWEAGQDPRAFFPLRQRRGVAGHRGNGINGCGGAPIVGGGIPVTLPQHMPLDYAPTMRPPTLLVEFDIHTLLIQPVNRNETRQGVKKRMEARE